MDELEKYDLAEEAVKEIVNDFLGRQGLRQGWEDIDEGIQTEIMSRWSEIIVETLNSYV